MTTERDNEDHFWEANDMTAKRGNEDHFWEANDKGREFFLKKARKYLHMISR